MEDKNNEQKPNVLTVKILGNDGTVIEVRARPSTKIEKLLQAYAQQKNVESKQIKLMDAEGKSLSPSSTLEECEIEDGDQLSVVIHQVGGTKFGDLYYIY
eukprot:TRINITY_DN3689_c0_g1_i1.p1 TRINITY_DN3689_c0_g1~~TRINITY_DN3689_c0_g1_i1.p1  ORF type:complete len:100 (+),score=28.99 TRINITY_DN3689_c0_g1_i1:48-347(+)